MGVHRRLARKIAAELKAPKPPAGTTLAIWGGRNLPNVWLGVSVENQAAAFERVPLLLQTPAAVRFISAEPLLGPVTLPGCNGRADCKLSGVDGHSDKPLGGIDWVICGGESGPGARPMSPDWARNLLRQCTLANVPFFFKQWGNWAPHTIPKEPELTKARGAVNWHEWPDGTWSHEWGKKFVGALLDGRECKQFPEAE